MKKHFIITSALMALFMMASCSEEDMPQGQVSGDFVTFKVAVPQISTRAISDGYTANRLYWGVYDHNGRLLPEISNTDNDGKDDMSFSGSGEVKLTLAQDKNYSIVFWAANESNSMCHVDWDGRCLSVEPKEANQESYDAFCAYVKIDNVSGYKTQEVKLYRPFAQLNIGTADYDKAAASGLTVQNTKIEVSGIPTAYDFVTGMASDETTFTYAYPEPAVDVRNDIDGDGKKEIFPVEDDKYDYLSMNYLLVGRDPQNPKELVTVTFKYKDDDDQEHERTYTSVPVQRNWRTNIYGNILTSETDFTVTIVPEFKDSVHNIEVWDGKTTEVPKITENTENPGEVVAEITNGAQLAWIAQMLNGTVNNARTTRSGEEVDYSEMTIKLGANIDLGNEQWTSIGTSEKPFSGKLEGNGYTISNLKIVETEAKEGKAYVGFFGYAKDVAIKNVTFDNVYINIACLDIDHSQGHIGAVVGSLEGTSTIDSVTVKGDIKVEATFDANGASRVAVVAGGNTYGDVTMKNVKVEAKEGSYLKANNNTGALAGQLQGKAVFENCSSNINVTVKKFFAGGIIGLTAGDSKFTNCHTTGDVAVVAGREGRHNDEYRVGGIAGGWDDGKTNVCTLTGCSYTGKVSGKNADGTVAEPLDYAGYVGRGYTLANCAGSKVVIDGVEYVQAYDDVYGLYTVNGKYLVCSHSALEKVLGRDESTSIVLGADIKGNVTVLQKEGVTITVDGNGHKFDGVITVNGDARAAGKETLTFKNINFETEGSDFTFISAPSKIDDKYNYSHNVTIENCTFKGNQTVGAASFTGTYNLVMKNCTATNMHSILQAQSCDNTVYVENVTTVDCKNGVSFGNTAYPTLKNSTIGAAEYGVRADGNASRGNLVIENTTITAEKPVLVRKMTSDSYNVKLTEKTILNVNAPGLYDVVFTNGSDDEEYVKPTGKYSIEGADDYIVYPVVLVKTADELIAALEQGMNVHFLNDIKIEPAKMSNAYGATGINVKYGQTINGAGHTLNIQGAGGTWDSGINTTGGVIKNLTVTGSFRGIFINHTSDHSEKVVLENVTIGGNGTVYTISCDQGLYQGIEATNCTFNGWTSFAKTAGEAKFVNCSFGEGSGYKYCRPYSDTEFVNCTFCPGYQVDETRATVTYTDCTWEK